MILEFGLWPNKKAGLGHKRSWWRFCRDNDGYIGLEKTNKNDNFL